jgi:hypothetical protein
MRTFYFSIFTMLCLLCIGGTTPQAAAASDNGAAPVQIAGSKLLYKDLHGSYVYTFLKDGTYTFAAVHQSGKAEDGRKGTFKYAITGPGKAKLTFDKEPVISLVFQTPLEGKLTVEDDVREHVFTITRPDGE